MLTFFQNPCIIIYESGRKYKGKFTYSGIFLDMKKICGIICEFNPLHEGHKYIIGEARRQGDVVCIMSGNFAQRGSSAVTEKYERAVMAADAGADLVVELPFPWCAAPAEFFARGGVTVAAALGVTDLFFGSESGDLSLIEAASRLEDDAEFCRLVSIRHAGAVGYAAARYEACLEYMPDVAGVFSSSNDMLAAEYIRQSRALGLAFCFHAVKRIDTPSASEIREKMNFHDGLEDILKTLFRLGKYDKGSFDSESGILSLLEKAARRAGAFSESARTKKYTDSRLRRAALLSVCGVKKSDLENTPDFTVLLAASDAGRRIVSGAKGIEVVTKPSDSSSVQYESEKYADTLYTLCMENAAADYFLKKSPYIY